MNEYLLAKLYENENLLAEFYEFEWGFLKLNNPVLWLIDLQAQKKSRPAPTKPTGRRPGLYTIRYYALPP